MGLHERVMELSQGAHETGRPIISSRPVTDEETLIGAPGNYQELIPRVDTEGIVRVNDAIERLNSLICCFSAITDRLEVEKREIFKIAKDVEKQRVDAGKLLYDLDQAIKAFPNIAMKNIHASVGATSHTLNEATSALVSEVRQAVSQIFKEEVKTLKQASVTASRSANELVGAKQFIGWQSIGINLLVVMVAALFLLKFATPHMQAYGPTAEEQKHINNGRFIEVAWPKLSSKTQHEINEAAKLGK